jgi:sensor domain DACNG-containing protein
MDPRTNRFLAGANLAARGLFQEVAPTLDPRVLRVAIPWDPLPPQAAPLVESHEDFPTPCWDAAFLQALRALGRLEPSARSTVVVSQRICTAISRCAGAEHFVHCCSPPVPLDGALVCVVLQLQKAAYAAVPRLGVVSQSPHAPGPCSLVDHAIRVYLADCPGELQNPATDPVRGWKPATEMLRAAGWALAAQAVALIHLGVEINRLSRSMVSEPITCGFVTHWVSTTHGMRHPQHKITSGTFRPLDHGYQYDMA